MKDGFAFITGIERYGIEKWNVAGPARTAVDMARWALRRVADAGNVHLFVAIAEAKHEAKSLAALQKDLEALRNDGVQVTESATRDVLYTFWRMQLLKTKAPRLFAYWCGHGGLNAAKQRLFYCQDYTDDLKQNVLDWSRLLESLHTSAAAGLKQQFALADVCGVYIDLDSPYPAGKEAPRKVEQVNFYATADGEYAQGMPLGGDFSRRALTVLEGVKGWPDATAFHAEILKDNPKQPFVITGHANDAAFPSERVGPAAPRSRAVDGALTLLQKQPQAESAYRSMYERTIAPLRVPDLWKAPTLSAMLGQLASLGRDQDETVPRPLIEFLLRCSDAPELRPAVLAWCKTEGVLDTTVKTLIEKLEQEHARHHLLIELVEDVAGRLTALAPVLYNHDLSLRVGPSWGTIALASDKELPGHLATVLTEARNQVGDAPLEVQFLVNPVLLGRALHEIEIKKDRSLGTLVPAIVRWRERVRHPQDCAPELWKQFDAFIREAGVDKLSVTPLGKYTKKAIDDGVLAQHVDPSKGLFVMSQLDHRTIAEALLLGVPFLCWTHDKGMPGTEIVEAVRGWANACSSLDDVPSALYQSRQKKQKVARAATLLWDTPRLVPDSAAHTPAGVRRLRVPGSKR